MNRDVKNLNKIENKIENKNNQKDIQNINQTSLAEFFDAMKKQTTLRSQITALKTEDDEINDKIFSFKKKICKYVQKGMEIAYERLNCDISTLYALATYDKAGIFLYFKYLSASFGQDTTLKGFSRSKSDKELYFEYGHDRILFLPTEIMPQDESYGPREFSDKIIELCKKNVEKLQENLKALKFE